MLEVDDGFGGLGVRKRVERNYNYRAETLRDNALRSLQIHFGLREIFGDDRLPLAQGELYRGLAGCQAFRWQAQATAAPRQADVQSTFVVSFQKHAAIGVHHRNSVIEHHAQHFVKRKL